MPVPVSTDRDSRCEGLAWTYDLDLEQLLATLGATQPGPAGDGQAAAEEAATEAEDGTARELTGAIADQLPPGPGLAAWISGTDPAAVGEWDLPGVASAYRRLAAWAQAGELAAVAEMASRTATRDDHVQVDEDGRPDQVTPAAASTVGLELVMSQPAAMAWTSLGVTLRWRLPATLAALSAGTIDLYRARLIAEATSPLDDDTARAVESAVLSRAGEQTSGQLRAALRRAVIAADPEGAEQRRKDAQRHAKVSLYPDPADGTATLAGTRLPSVHAAAAMARLTAIARAMKSAGQAGGLDYLRATAFIGLLLGTLPLVAPPAGNPGPDAPTNPDPAPDDPGPSDPNPGRPGPGEPRGDQPGPDSARPGDHEADASSHHCDSGDADAHRDPRPDEPAPPDEAPADEPAPPDPGPPYDPGARYQHTDEDQDDGPYAPDPPGDWPPLPATATQTPPFLGQPPSSHPPPTTHPPPAGQPPPRGQPGPPGHPPPATNSPPATHPPPRGRPGPPPRGHRGPSPRGLLELVISWRALNGDPAGPATLSRVGPITAATLAQLDDTSGTGGGIRGTGRGILAAVLRAARRAHARAQHQATADAATPGGCAHTTATAAYRPTPKIRDHVTARDQTCRNPRCRQPARHTDLDHTTAWHKGGPTCPCNLGGHCRAHHQIKQLPGWTLIQAKPGHFQLTTPAGRTYTTAPDPYPT